MKIAVASWTLLPIVTLLAVVLTLPHAVGYTLAWWGRRAAFPPTAMLGALLFLLCWPSTSSGEETPQGHPRVVLIAGEEPQQTAPLVQAVRGQLSDLEVVFQLHVVDVLPVQLPEQLELAREVSRSEGAVSVFWLDHADSNRVYLYLTGESGDRVLVRELAEPDEPGRHEALAIIVRSSVDAMLRGGRIGIEHLPAESPASPPAGAQPAPASVLSAGLSFALKSHSGTHPALAGLDLRIGLRVYRRLTVLVGYTFVQPMEVDGASASARVLRHPARAGLGLSWTVGAFRLGPSLCLVVDYTTARAHDLAPGLTAIEDVGDLVLGLAPAAEIGLSLSRWSELLVVLEGEVPLNGRRYVVDAGGGREVLLEPWRFRPGLRIGFRVHWF